MEDTRLKKAFSALRFLKDMFTELEKEVPEAEEHMECLEKAEGWLKIHIKNKLFEEWTSEG